MMGCNVAAPVLDTKGHCFLCLDKIENELSSLSCTTNSTDKLHYPQLYIMTSPIYPLQCLTRYLGMSINNELDITAGHRQGSKLMVSLCQGCGGLADQFTKKYEQLQKIRMELMSSLELIHGKLLSAAMLGKTDEFRKLMGISSETGDKETRENREKLKYIERLRLEAMQKCFRKLNQLPPRVKVLHMSSKQIHRAKEKFVDFKDNPKKMFTLKVEGDETTTDMTKVKVEPSIIVDFKSEDAYYEHFDGSKPDLSHPSFQNSLSLPETSLEMGTDLHSLVEIGEIKLERGYVNLPTDNGDDSDNDRDDDYRPDTTQDSESDELEEESPSEVVKTSLPKPTPKVKKLQPVPAISKMYLLIPNTNKFKCLACPIEFKNTWNAKKHYKSQHLNVTHACEKCKKVFKQAESLHRHNRSTHVGIRFACDGCNQSFTQQTKLRQHQRMKTCTKKLIRVSHSSSLSLAELNHQTKDEEAALEFNSESLEKVQKLLIKKIKGSVDPQHPKTKFRCTICAKEFGNQFTFTYHQQSAHENLTFACQRCNKGFNLKCNLLQHQRTRGCGLGSASNNGCGHCGKTFAIFDELQKHWRTVHFTKPDGKFGCDLCGKIMKWGHGLRRHKENVHGVVASKSVD